MTGQKWLMQNFGDESELELARRLIKGVCMIPASGEFVYDTVEVVNNSGNTENKHRTGSSNTDFVNSVADLKTYLPNAKLVNLVTAWFGTDLRMSQCLIKPGLENGVKTTTPYSWQVADRTRSNGYLINTDVTGTPYFGGTPSDLSIVRAIRHLASQGFKVMFYPFLMMDIQPGNSKPDPYSSNSYQPQQPWRGTITTDKHLSMGSGITTDKTTAVNTHVSAFFGNAAASNITCSVDAASNAITYSLGSYTPDWRFRFQILHYAKLCAAINAVQPNAVTSFMVATEMRELLCVRDASNNFPAVTALNTLLNDVKGIFTAAGQNYVEISYASDWSETTGYKPIDNTGFWFHLDPIWSNTNCSFIGIDNYLPISDWLSTSTSSNTNWMMGYYESWEENYSPPLKIASPPSNMDVMVLAFAKADLTWTTGQTTWTSSGLNFVATPAQVKAAIVTAKTANSNLKVVLSIGSGNSSYNNWGSMNTAQIVTMINDLGLDGVDIDYENLSPGCTTIGGVVSCTQNTTVISIINALRTALPRPKILTMTGWSTGAYGEGIYATAPPSGSPWKGSMLDIFRNSGASAALDAVLVMTYGAGNTYNSLQAAQAYRAAWPTGRIVLGIENPRSDATATLYDNAGATALANNAMAIYSSTAPIGVFVYAMLSTSTPTGLSLYNSAATVIKAAVIGDGATPAGLDYDAFGGTIYNQAYLQSRIEGGELYDYTYYSNPVRPTSGGYSSWYSPPQPTNDRNAQNRHTIVDPQSLGKPWMFKLKDLRNFWLNQHFNRPGNVESGTPTAWVPQSKRFAFTEYGISKIDRATNQPNVFTDARSSQGGLPYYSSQAIDKRMQLSYYIAWNKYWSASGGRNPISTVYSDYMLDLTTACAWCWDARPYPEFPLYNEIWNDGVNFARGHWLEDNFMFALPDLSSRKIVLYLGQSNAEKHFYRENDLNGVPADEGIVYLRNKLAQLYGIFTTQILCIRGAVGGTSLLKKMNFSDNPSSFTDPHGYWWDEDTNMPSPLAIAAKTLLNNTQGTLLSIIYDGHETDTINVDPGNGTRTVRKGLIGGGITMTEFKTSFTNLINWIRSPTGMNTNVPIVFSGIGVNFFPSITYMETGGTNPLYRPPEVRQVLMPMEKCQRDLINSLTNVYRGPKRSRIDGDPGPEYIQSPEMSKDGIHLSGPGYETMGTRLAQRIYDIVNTPIAWSSNSDNNTGAPNTEYVFMGSSVSARLNGSWKYTVNTISRTSNILTINLKYPHLLLSSDVGATFVIKDCNNTGLNGNYVLNSLPTSGSITAISTGVDIASFAAVGKTLVVFDSGIQICKNALVTSLGVSATDLSIQDFTAEASRLDYESDFLGLVYNSYFGYGNWWTPSNTPGVLGECLGDYLAQRGSKIKGIVIDLGQVEAFVENETITQSSINSITSTFGYPTYTGGTISGYSATAKYLVRMRQLIAYLRTRNGNSNLKIFIVRMTGQVYTGTYYEFTSFINAQNTLVTDPNVYYVAYPRSSPIGGEADLTFAVDSANSGFIYTCKGYQTLGNRIANGLLAHP